MEVKVSQSVSVDLFSHCFFQEQKAAESKKSWENAVAKRKEKELELELVTLMEKRRKAIFDADDADAAAERVQHQLDVFHKSRKTHQ